MKKIIFLFLLSFNFLIADMYSDWNVQDLGSMAVLLKYSTDKLGMLTLGCSDITGDNIQIIHSKLNSGKTTIKIDYDNSDSKLYDLSKYVSGVSIIISGNTADNLINELYNAKELLIYSGNNLVCRFELKNLTSLLKKYR